ncbi:hypothetical protein D5W64_12585 [Salmonella enterica subsp. enterica serovar Saintpaul]|nr:hypothetical protein [Salmonella enterica subsp. enterica serovar Saintpaul]
MKSIIGYYSTPLTQEEREVCLNHYHMKENREFTDRVLYDVNRLIGKVVRSANGEIVSEQLCVKMTETTNELLREYGDMHSSLEAMTKLSVEYKLNANNNIIRVESTELNDLINGKLVFPHTVSRTASRIEDEEYICQLYNEFLFEHPEVRLVQDTPLSKSINKANDALLKRLQSSNYESATRNIIYDFSDILLDLARELK